MQKEIDVGKHFSKYSKQYYANVHGPLQEAYQNVGAALDERLYGTVLDIGNGGVFFYDINGLEKIIAVDLVYPKEMEKTNKITFYSGDARDLSFLEDNTADCVLMQFLLHHVVEKTPTLTDKSLTKLLSEAHRVLKSNGQLIIIEPLVLPILELFENIFYNLNSFLLRTLNKPMVRFYCKSSLMLHIEGAGYSNVTCQKISLGNKWIPLAPALFPGKFVIPPWLYPTRFCCITASKHFVETRDNKRGK